MGYQSLGLKIDSLFSLIIVKLDHFKNSHPPFIRADNWKTEGRHVRVRGGGVDQVIGVVQLISSNLEKILQLEHGL